MTKLLDRLESKGLLQRRPHPDDRRAVMIELTDEGRALVPPTG
jgi:DNA-binding MarR family transcriptional regulator